MKSQLKSFESYMRHTLGFTTRTVEKYMGNLLILCRDLNLTSIADLQNVDKKWQAEIWQIMQEKHGLTDNTTIVYQSALKKFIRYLEDNGDLPAGSADGIELARPSYVYIEGLSIEEKEALRHYLSTHLKNDVERRNAALINFLLATAVRIDEALQLQVHGDGVIYTRPLIRSGDFHISDKNMYVHINGKGKRNRNIVVSQEALGYLNLYLWNRVDKSKQLFLNYGRGNEVGPLGRGGAYYVVHKVFKDAGIPKPQKICTHIMRHTAIEEWIKKGISTKIIIAMTGHANENSLEPYFRRHKELTKVFAEEGNILKSIKTNKDIERLEKLLTERYAFFYDS